MLLILIHLNNLCNVKISPCQLMPWLFVVPLRYVIYIIYNIYIYIYLGRLETHLSEILKFTLFVCKMHLIIKMSSINSNSSSSGSSSSSSSKDDSSGICSGSYGGGCCGGGGGGLGVLIDL